MTTNTNTNGTFGEFLQTVAYHEAHRGGWPFGTGKTDVTKRFEQFRAMLASDQNRTNSDPAGGFAVGSGFATDLLTRAFDFSTIAKRCRKLFVPTASLSAPLFRETTRADGSRLGGVRSSWKPQGVDSQPAYPSYASLTLTPKTLIVVIPVSEELADSAPALEQTVTAAASEEIATVLDACILTGTVGVPLGVVNDPGTIVVTKESGQSAATVNATNLNAMLRRLWPYSFPNAAWFVSPSVFAAMTGDTTIKTLLRFAEPGAAPGSAVATLLGLPLFVTEHNPPLGTIGDIVLGDFQQYAIGDRGDATFASSVFARYQYHEKLFRIVYRVDGHSMFSTPVTAKNDGVTQSAFVVLETRS